MDIHWTERMIQLCNAKKPNPWSLADLARASGVDSKLIYKWVELKTKSPSPAKMAAICGALRVSEEFLRFGTGQTGPDFPKVVLLTMNEVGTLTKDQPLQDAWDQVSYEYVPLKPGQKLSAKAFAVVVNDNACSPNYLAGDTVICEPINGRIEPGKFVVAQVDALEMGVLRRFRPKSMSDMSSFTLVATDERFYPDIEVDPDHPGQILGRVVKVIRDSE